MQSRIYDRTFIEDVGALSQMAWPRHTLRPYQARVARSVVRSVMKHAGNQFVVVFARQSGKDELLAQLSAYLMWRAQLRGGSIITVTPTLRPQGASPVIGASLQTGIRQTWSLWGYEILLGSAASGDEVGSSRLVIRHLLPWDRLDPVEAWNGPEGDERQLVLWCAAQAYAWLEGQEGKRARNPAAGVSSVRYADQLEREISARRRAATSRQLEEG